VPNRGRDIAPLLTEFARTIVDNYDIVGHVHTKRTADLTDGRIGESWYRFLLENLVGGRAPMADEILSRMAAEPHVGMVFPDDPHIVGWTGNRAGARELTARLQLGSLPENPVFPVGSMFWARVPALRSLFGLGGWPPRRSPSAALLTSSLRLACANESGSCVRAIRRSQSCRTCSIPTVSSSGHIRLLWFMTRCFRHVSLPFHRWSCGESPLRPMRKDSSGLASPTSHRFSRSMSASGRHGPAAGCASLTSAAVAGG
jgi:hypothetical protein